MEASRLVFVYVKDAKPKRKVAVPVPDGYSWEDFLQQVKQKLKIVGVKEVHLVSSGQRVTSLDELQDIDELCVTEGIDTSRSVAISIQGSLPTGADGTAEISHQHSERQQVSPHGQSKSSGLSNAHNSSHKHSTQDSDDSKYTRRSHPLKRMIQKWFPSLFAPALPVSTRDISTSDTDKGSDVGRLKKRKGRRNAMSLRSVLLLLAVMTCLVTMFWFMMRAGPTVT